jgi:hypothetical protein
MRVQCFFSRREPQKVLLFFIIRELQAATTGTGFDVEFRANPVLLVSAYFSTALIQFLYSDRNTLTELVTIVNYVPYPCDKFRVKSIFLRVKGLANLRELLPGH